QEILELINLPEDRSPIVISLPGNNLDKIRSLLPALFPQCLQKDPQYSSTDKKENQYFNLQGNGLNAEPQPVKKNVITKFAGEETDVSYESYKTIFYN